MDLPPGMTCADCVHCRRCTMIFGHIPQDQVCDWSPSRFHFDAGRAEYHSWFPIRASGVATRSATRFGKPYLDGLIDRLLMPLPSMPASAVQKLMGEAAEMIHQFASRAGSVAVGRVLDPSDPFCPKCGHNRDTSSVSSIDHGGGRQSCQKCGAAWREVPHG